MALLYSYGLAGPVRRSLAFVLAIVIVLAAVVLWGARPGPAFTVSAVHSVRQCSYNTSQGNVSDWVVFFNLTNEGTSANAPVTIAVDGSGVFFHYYAVATGTTVAVHRVVTDSAVPTDPACLAHNVTVAVGGYVF